MREAISDLMLTLDEMWLTHAARLRLSSSVSVEDVKFEDLLFKVEALLAASQSQLAPVSRSTQPGQPDKRPDTPEMRAPQQVRRWGTARSQPR